MRCFHPLVRTLTIASGAAGSRCGLTQQKRRLAAHRRMLRGAFGGGSAAGPREAVATITLDKSAPLPKDTTAGIEFQGLTGMAASSLVGGAPTAPPVPLDHDGVPVLTADLKDQETMVETVHNVDKFVVSNAP